MVAKIFHPPQNFNDMKMTPFSPEKHGFKFTNDFKVSTQIAGLNFEFYGQCGGMAYTALDFFHTGKPVPTQNFRPAAGTILAAYIYDRQQTSLLNNVDKWGELIFNPFGWRTNEFFNWGLEAQRPGDRINELKNEIDNGKPVPLGLFKAGNGGTGPHHQVLAIGYDLGRYRGDLGDHINEFKIFIYDPNCVGQIVTLVADTSNKSYHYVEYPTRTWMTYFVDRKYKVKTPPNISSGTLSNNGLVKELRLEICTGGDDLRGGNDNVHAIVNLKNGTSQIFHNINGTHRWVDYYTETVPVILEPAVPLNQIKSLTLKTTFGGGIGGDNWNIDSLRIIAKDGSTSREVYEKSGSPLVRFTGSNTPFEAFFD